MFTDNDIVKEFVDKVTVDLGDSEHRERGLWVLDIVNPNACPGAAEVLAT